jgi:hypothetical protein
LPQLVHLLTALQFLELPFLAKLVLALLDRRERIGGDCDDGTLHPEKEEEEKDSGHEYIIPRCPELRKVRKAAEILDDRRYERHGPHRGIYRKVFQGIPEQN